MEEFITSLRLKSEHCDVKRDLRLDTLLHLIQEASVSHTEELGMGREKTLDKGLLWVMDKEVIEIRRLPQYDEEIQIITSPSKTLHFFFPRRTEIQTKDGEVLLRAMTLWSLIDAKTRQFIDPEKHGIRIDGQEREDDLNIITPSIKTETLTKHTYLKADYTGCDLNGHLNNASYLNFAQNVIPNEELLHTRLTFIGMTFLHEVKLGERIKVSYGKEKNDWNFASKAFRLSLKYQKC